MITVLPSTSRRAVGAVVPMPTLPLFRMRSQLASEMPWMSKPLSAPAPAPPTRMRAMSAFQSKREIAPVLFGLRTSKPPVPSARTEPTTCSRDDGLAVPMPTFPVTAADMLLPTTFQSLSGTLPPVAAVVCTVPSPKRSEPTAAWPVSPSR